MAFDSRPVETEAVDRAGTIVLGRAASRWLVKAGAETVRVDTRGAASIEDAAVRYLLHEDGFLRVPVLLMGDLLVRGFTDDLYREAFAALGAS